MTFKTVDLFSGIGGLRLGFEKACDALGFEHSCVFASDINKNACKVYRRQFGESLDPLCDITKVDPNTIPDVDVLMAGFPCQAFSMAGRRQGFDDVRGTLFFNIAKILEIKKPAAVLLENVRGLTSHDKGRTFKVILRVLGQLGYKVDYAVLNSKNFGVPQNRPRIYIVAFLTNDEDYSDLFKFAFPEPVDSDKRLRHILFPNPVDEIYYLSKSYWSTLMDHKQRHAAKGHGFGYVIKNSDDIANTLMCGGMGIERNLIIDDSDRLLPEWANTDRVRKMTPVEWERLQGFPDGWTDAAPTSSRWTLLGNSVTVPVVEAVSKQMIGGIVSPNKMYHSSIFG